MEKKSFTGILHLEPSASYNQKYSSFLPERKQVVRDLREMMELFSDVQFLRVLTSVIREDGNYKYYWHWSL